MNLDALETCSSQIEAAIEKLKIQKYREDHQTIAAIDGALSYLTDAKSDLDHDISRIREERELNQPSERVRRQMTMRSTAA